MNTARIQELLQQLQQGKLSRRSFVRSAVLLGLSAGVAKALAACGQQPGPTAVPTPTYSAPLPLATHTLAKSPMEMEMGQHPIAPVVKEIATYVPPPTSAPVAPTPTLALWQGTAWSCPACLQEFGTQEELVQHVLTGHAVKTPGARRVDKPTYARYLTEQVERFDQRNHVFSRTTWDKELQASLGAVQPRPWNITAEEMLEGNARVAGGIYVDKTGGNPGIPYRGYSGHLQGAGGLYGWNDPVSEQKVVVSDRAAMSAQVKEVARLYGADLVGITEVNPLWIYSHYYDRETMAYGKLEMPLQYAIVMGLEMDAAGIRKSPGYAASAATSTIYSKMAEVSSKLAKYIRGLGYAAVPSGNDTGQNIPLAIDAGLGEIGRLGLLLTPQFGARQRLCKVFTDLPLAVDQPIDFGMQWFCETCLHCAHVCPAQAIPRGERSVERTSISNRPGIKRWHVNVSNCFLFWQANRGVDCSNCIAACPWSQTSRPWL